MARAAEFRGAVLAAVALAALVMVAFVVVVQPTASVLRAAVMGAITVLAVVSARRRQAIPALAATVIALLALAPQLAVDIGFALSVSATAALMLQVNPGTVMQGTATRVLALAAWGG